ncbi:MAG: hypothetical protein ABI761_15085 [Saprospiraceae bacterium]
MKTQISYSIVLLYILIVSSFRYSALNPDTANNKGTKEVEKKKIFNPDFDQKPSTENLFSDSSGTPGLRAHHALVYDENKKCIILTAGSTPLNGGSDYIVYDDVWSFKGKKWIPNQNTGDKRSSIRLAYDTKRKKIYSFGGYSPDSSFCDLRVLDNGQWNIISRLPPMRASECGFVYDIKRDKLIVFGGSSTRGQVNKETWEWNGTIWKKFNGDNPPGRQAFAMVYDSKRNKTILYGGMGTSPDETFEDTWEYNGSSWTLVNEKGPGPLHGMGFTYDSKRGQFILFSGMSKSGRNRSTWAFNGSVWNRLSEQGPPARAMGYMAYDKKRDRVVMFGGRITWPNDVNDTWEWDGTSWTEIKY